VSLLAIQRAAIGAFVLALLVFGSGAAQTKGLGDSRWIVRNQGEAPEPPSCHSLQYFLDDPVAAERAIDSEFPVELESSAVRQSVMSVRVGEIAGFEIYSLIDQTASALAPQETYYIKMILVQRSPGEYCEIYNDLDERTAMATVRDAYLLSVRSDTGSETLLGSKDPFSGTGGLAKEEYWTFDDQGPIWVNYESLLGQTVQKLLPPGGYAQAGSFDIKTLSFRAGVSKEGDCASCVSDGSVHVQFAIRDHRLEIVSEEYVPPAERQRPTSSPRQ
jgi:hypothetical protein